MDEVISIQELENFSDKVLSTFHTLLPQLNPEITPLSKEDLVMMIADKNLHIFLAVNSNHDIVGTLTLHAYQTFSGKRGSIEDVVVDEKARNQGIGRKLLERGIEKARELGLEYVDLTSRPTRVAANHLYQKLGFAKRETNVYRFIL